MKKCLISLLLIQLLGLSTANSETLEGWQYEEYVDEFTDKVSAVSATVYSSDVLAIDQQIFIYCSKPANSLKIGIQPSNTYLSFKKFEKVKIRIDKNPTRVDNGVVARRLVGVWNNVSSLAREMMKGESMIVQVGDSSIIRASLKGSRKPIQKVLTSCNIN